MKAKFVVMVLLSLFIAFSAYADYAPNEIAFHGRIFAAGCGYSANPQTMEVRLYNAPTGGTQIGSVMTIADVGVTDGVISVVLTGSIVTEILNHNTADGPLYLEYKLTTSGWTSDRKKLTSTPYALTATEADKIGGLTLSNMDGRYILAAPASMQTGNIWISGYIRSEDGSTGIQGKKFVDVDSGTYVLDPNGTSTLNTLNAGTTALGSTTMSYGKVTGILDANGGASFRGTLFEQFGGKPRLNANADNVSGGGIAVSDDGGFYDYNDAYITYKGSTGLKVDTGLSLLAPIFKDTNDPTNFYLDPNGISYLNDIRPYIMYDRDNTGYYVDPNNTSNINGLQSGYTVVSGGLKTAGTVSTAFGSNATIYANNANVGGGGIMVSDDGGFFDYNDGWIQYRGSYGIYIRRQSAGTDWPMFMLDDYSIDGGRADMAMITAHANWNKVGTNGNYFYEMHSNNYYNHRRALLNKSANRLLSPKDLQLRLAELRNMKIEQYNESETYAPNSEEAKGKEFPQHDDLVLVPASAPPEVLNDEGKAISLPNLDAFTIAAMKALDENVQRLQKENEDLKELVNELLQRVETLEQKQ